VSVAAMMAVAASPGALADADAAKGYLKEARDLVEHRELQAAVAKLELAEAELDDAAADEKPAIAAAIKDLHQQIVGASAAADKPKYKRKLGLAMDDAEQSIGSLATWPTAEREFNEVFDDPAAKAALGAELDAAAKKFATFKRLHAKKAAVQIEAEVDNALKNTEERWAESKAKILEPGASPEAKAPE